MAPTPRIAVARPRIAGRAPACGGCWRDDRRRASAASGVGWRERGQRSRRGGEPTGSRGSCALARPRFARGAGALPISHGPVLIRSEGAALFKHDTNINSEASLTRRPTAAFYS